MSRSSPRPTKVAAIGEGMVELSPGEGGQFRLGFGGDTLNTAVYLARLGVRVDYLTALGDDPLSDRMVAAWRADGVGTDRVIHRPGRLPGLYLIENDERGERRFYYWRDRAPARDLFALPETDSILAALPGYDCLYLSGISLSLYGAQGRSVLFDALDRVRRQGGRVVFDINYRPAGWPDRATARQAVEAMLARVDVMVTGTEDEQLLFGETDLRAAVRRYQEAGIAEVIVKCADAGALVVVGGDEALVPAEPIDRVVDATAAGDSFNAAYLAARFAGASPQAAARAGHRLAAAVIGRRGAIIPAGAMPAGILDVSPTIERTER